MSEVANKLAAMLKSKQYKDYLACVKKGSPKNIEKLETLLAKMLAAVQEISQLKEKKETSNMFAKTIEVLDIAKKILELESDKDTLTYSATQCTEPLVNLSIYRHKIQMENLEKSQEMLKGIVNVMVAKKPSASSSKRVTKPESTKKPSASAKKSA
jgi:hypothetical protein